MKHNQFLAVVFGLVMFALSPICCAEEERHNFHPPAGYVPDEATAVRIAEAVWLPIYGESVLKEKPFHAKLANGIWIVGGTLPEGYIGGTAEAEISKKDGCILRISHGK